MTNPYQDKIQPTNPLRNIFILPVLDNYLLYSPLHQLSAIINKTAVQHLQKSLTLEDTLLAGSLGEIAEVLRQQVNLPKPKQGPFSPNFLGLIPTRGCNLACRYCNFWYQGKNQVMDQKLAADSVSWYMEYLKESGAQHGEIHFFGGEPFYAFDVVEFVVHYASYLAEKENIQLSFEVATNGIMNPERCRWVADHFTTITLSFDGPADIQDLHRPLPGDKRTSRILEANAYIFSEYSQGLFFRSCVTSQTVKRMPQIAEWFCQNYQPKGICFETLQTGERTLEANLEPPDPWNFAQKYSEASSVMEQYGVVPIYSTADTQTKRVSFCPVGNDVAIISPDGGINACYLLSEEWEGKGLDLNFGQVEDGHFSINPVALENTRKLNVWNEKNCELCFCKWHCAGGCHVNNPLNDSPGIYDALCIQTRLITLRNILHTLERDDLICDIFSSHEAMQKSVVQSSDLLIDFN